jgi:hypothetical protein
MYYIAKCRVLPVTNRHYDLSFFGGTIKNGGVFEIAMTKADLSAFVMIAY